MTLLAVVLMVLLVSCVMAYELAVTRERADDAQRLRVASMDRAMTDMDGRCWVCTAECAVLELVDTGTRYELACLPCATVAKAVRTFNQENAA